MTERIAVTQHGYVKYARVPRWLISTVSRGARDTYLILATFADNDTHTCYPTLGTVAELAGVCERTVRKDLRELQDAGALRIEEQYDDSGARRENLYHLAWNPPQDAQGAGDTQCHHPGDTQCQGLTTPMGTSKTPDGVLQDSEMPRADVDEVITALTAHVLTATSRKPRVTKAWHDQVRLMLDGPGKEPPEWSVEQLLFVIRWLDTATRDAQFWSPNVLCPSKLRAQMPKLVAAIRRERAGNAAPDLTQRIAGIRAAAAAPSDGSSLAERFAAMRDSVAS